MTFTIVQGDTAPPITSRLTDAGNPVDISNVSNIYFYMEDKFNRIVVSDDLTGRVNIVDGVGGVVEYAWKKGDTDNVGSYKAQWDVLYDDGKRETFPTSGAIDIEMVEKIE